jgi:CelD/BcsL family acetyltransferase involved in cellulose biosynthesis
LSESVGAGRGVFDFLKGDEAYKFRMGADPRELYVVEGTT